MFEVLALFLGRGQLCQAGVHDLTVPISVSSYGALGLLYLINTSFSSPNALWRICLQLLSACFVMVIVHCRSNQVRDGMSAWALGHSGTSLGLYVKQVLALLCLWRGTRTCPASI